MIKISILLVALGFIATSAGAAINGHYFGGGGAGGGGGGSWGPEEHQKK